MVQIPESQGDATQMLEPAVDGFDIGPLGGPMSKYASTSSRRRHRVLTGCANSSIPAGSPFRSVLITLPISFLPQGLVRVTVCSDQVPVEPPGDLQGGVIPQQVHALFLPVGKIARFGQQAPAVLVQWVILPPPSPGGFALQALSTPSELVRFPIARRGTDPSLPAQQAMSGHRRWRSRGSRPSLRPALCPEL